MLCATSSGLSIAIKWPQSSKITDFALGSNVQKYLAPSTRYNYIKIPYFKFDHN
jgi:hypothetical protein